MTSAAVVRKLVRTLEVNEVHYVLVGALATNVYGLPRATGDADFVIVFKSGVLSRIENDLGSEFSVDPQLMLEVLTGTLRNQITHRPSEFVANLFRLGSDPHHQRLFERRVRASLPEIRVSVWIPTAEDIIIQKLRWARRKDEDDIVNVLSVQGDHLDRNYLEEWTTIHGTQELLQKLQAEVPDTLP